ncbi:hypothetical protein B0H13DRAFT_254740 [Mycena leptocephala]|nr:hypothetical protein B0H13DRAFT_254740 [Mycena leptocephala]
MDSPFQDIVDTNFVPSDEECQKIRDFLEDAQKEVTDLTEELARLDALRKELSRKWQQLKEFIDAHLALVSPVRRLPEDIIRSIFVASLPLHRNPTISGQEAPLLLGQICRSWRSIALTTPRLWAAIHIVIPDQSLLQQLMDRVAIWFERSGVVPLDISVVLSRTCGTGYDISSLHSALVAVSPRWKHLEMPIPDEASPLLSLTSTDVPFLEAVKISQQDRTLAPPDCTPLLFLASDSLRHLTLPASPSCLETPVSWKCLTLLNITQSRSHLTSAAALAILRQSTALRTCDIVITDIEGEVGVPGEPFSLPELAHFSVRRNGVLPRDHLFGSLALPNLRDLEYYSSGGSIEMNLPQLLPSTPSLESFIIFARGLRSNCLLDVLSRMPALKSLTILDEPCSATSDAWFLPRDNKFLEYLALSQGPESAPVVCPCLERIELQNFSAVSDETLLQFVQSRTHESTTSGVPHLSRVTGRFLRRMDFDVKPHLADAIAGGLSVVLSYTKPGFTYSPLEGTVDFNNWNSGDTWGVSHEWEDDW